MLLCPSSTNSTSLVDIKLLNSSCLNPEFAFPGHSNAYFFSTLDLQLYDFKGVGFSQTFNRICNVLTVYYNEVVRNMWTMQLLINDVKQFQCNCLRI